MVEPARDADGDVVSVTQRVAAEVPHASMDLLAAVHAVEKLATARSVSVATNGNFPHWTLERWLAVLTFAIAAFTASVGGIWFAGGEWQRMKVDIDAVRAAVQKVDAQQQDLKSTTQELKVEIESIQKVDEYYRTTSRRGPTFPKGGGDK